MAGQHVFISYSRRDSEYVGRLVAYLQAHAIPAWADSAINYGEHWEDVIIQQIDHCAAFVPVMTPTAWASPWVRNEVARARLKDKPILPLLLAGEHFFGLSHLEAEDVSGGQLPKPTYVARLQSLVGPVTQGVRYPAPVASTPSRRGRWLWPAVAAAVVLAIVATVVVLTNRAGTTPTGTGTRPSATGTPTATQPIPTGPVVEHLQKPRAIGPLTLEVADPPSGTENFFVHHIARPTSSVYLVYQNPDNVGEQFVVYAATGDVTALSSALTDYLPGVDAKTLASADPGRLSGEARCAAVANVTSEVACAWADPGSLGTGYCTKATVAQCSALFTQIRDALLTRE